MKKGKRKPLVLLIAGILLAIFALIMLSTPDGYYGTIIGFILAAICIVLWLIERSQSGAKNTNVVEGTFTGIAKYGDGWVGCYFEIDGKETRVSILNEVYNPKLLMPGGTYKLTLNKKDQSVVSVERIG